MGRNVVPMLRFLPFPLSDSYRKKCVYTCLDYCLLLGNSEVVVGEEWGTERERVWEEPTVTLNEILFSGGTQLENIRTCQTAHVCECVYMHMWCKGNRLFEVHMGTYSYLLQTRSGEVWTMLGISYCFFQVFAVTSGLVLVTSLFGLSFSNFFIIPLFSVSTSLCSVSYSFMS